MPPVLSLPMGSIIIAISSSPNCGVGNSSSNDNDVDDDDESSSSFVVDHGLTELVANDSDRVDGDGLIDVDDEDNGDDDEDSTSSKSDVCVGSLDDKDSSVDGEYEV